MGPWLSDPNNSSRFNTPFGELATMKTMAFGGLMCGLIAWACPTLCVAQDVLVPNASFEDVDPSSGFASGWIRGFGPGTRATAEVDASTAHSGARSLRITDATPTEAYKYALVNSAWLAVKPRATYELHCHVRGIHVGKAFVGIACEGAGEHRQGLPVGDYEWREVTFRFTVPHESRQASIRFVADGVTEGLWIDSVRCMISPLQLGDIPEIRYERRYSSWYPRTPGPVAERLVVVDLQQVDYDTRAMLTALQGIVNRQSPRLYLLNPTNPPGNDAVWLEEMRRQGYTGPDERELDAAAAVSHFRDEVQGVVVWDPTLPASANAAWMLAGIKNALPTSPAGISRFDLPVVEDLRGRWTRNVDVYRDIFDQYWDQMCPHVLAWEYPLANAIQSRDVMVQHRVFQFWVTAYTDDERGSDPPAETAFLEELLMKTPGNVPVMGWPMYVDKGLEEYTAVRLLSEYGKWVPGTGFTSNGSVHSAIRPPTSVFRQRDGERGPATIPRCDDKLYVTTNILDSGDAHWYWQCYQRQIWADPLRGAVPTGYGMNVTLIDALPLVAQWYYEHRAPRDSFFAFIYMNAPVYASRFSDADRERIWHEFVDHLDNYRTALDMDGIELYCGGSAGPSASPQLLQRFTRGMPHLSYILAGLGRHADTTPENATQLLDDVAVFRTSTDFRVWTRSEDVHARTMEDENRWLLREIAANAPGSRPGFVSALAVSWIYYPAWLDDLCHRFPGDYQAVSPGEMAEIFRQSLASPGDDSSHDADAGLPKP